MAKKPVFDRGSFHGPDRVVRGTSEYYSEYPDGLKSEEKEREEQKCIQEHNEKEFEKLRSW